MSFIVAGVAGAGLGALGSVGGALISANAASNAADKQAAGAKYATDLQNQGYQQQRSDMMPWMDAGRGALSQMGQMTQNAPSFTGQDFQNNMDPGYGFLRDQGQLAMQRSAAAKGGLQTTGTLKALNGYTQGLASQEYEKAYSRFMNNQNTQFSRLSSLAGMGQGAASQMGNASMANAGSLGNIAMGAANAAGAADIARGNIWGNAITGIGKSVQGGISTAMTGGMMPSGLGSMGGGGGGDQGTSLAGQPYYNSRVVG